MKAIFILVSSVVSVFIYSACDKEEKNDPAENSTFLKVTRSELPACDSSRSGVLAYITDEKAFVTCDGTTWDSVDSGGSGVAVTQSDGTQIGTLVFADWPGIAVKFSDDAWGGFFVGGTVYTGYCETSLCNKTNSLLGTYGVAITPPTGSSCFYTAKNCSGTCYLADKPIANSLFTHNSTWLKATGAETDNGAKSIQSFWRTDYGDCYASVVGSISKSYPVTNAYGSFPSGVTYPFKGPLKFSQ